MRILSCTVLLLAACGSASSGTVVQSSVPVTTNVSSGAGEIELRGSQEVRQSSHVVPLSSARAWEALPALYQELGIRGEVLDAAQMVFGTRGQNASGRLAGARLSTFFNCGSGGGGLPVANTYRVEFAVMSQLHPLGERTEIRTAITAEATPQTVSGESVRCTTTGALEARLAQLLGERAG